MTIPEIKSRLSIAAVLQHYALTPDRNQMLRCPFHPDKTPSMQIYPKTNTAYCFSANCQTHGKSLDQIDFIMLMEKCSKHEAILKAKNMLTPMQNLEPKQDKNRIAVLNKLMYDSQQSLKRSKRAQQYCIKRGLNYEQVEIGFLGERFYQGWTDALRKTAVEIGLLKLLKNGMLSPTFKSCLVFGLRNRAGNVVGIYGRSITGKAHFYLKGRHQGIFPKWPIKSCKQLIISESVIDTATLLRIEKLKEEYEIIALYGTNGLTDDHRNALKNLPDLAEIILMLDGDDAGDAAVEKYAKELHKMLPNAEIYQAELPQEEDVNSLLVESPDEIIFDILEKRRLLFSIEQKALPLESIVKKNIENNIIQENNNFNQLNTENPDKIFYETAELRITIWGGIEYGNLHRLKLSLFVENKINNQSFRDDVNLYSNRSKKAFLREAAEELEISEAELKLAVSCFTKTVESFRMQRKEKRKTLGKTEAPKLTELERAKALKLLKDSDLASKLKAAMQRIGLIGEAQNGLLLFLIFLTRNFEHPLHALVHGSSGSGKTNLLKSILKLVPEESKYVTTALTENVLFRPPFKEFWKNKILLLEDLDGSYKALYPLREFMSNQYISKYVTDPDPRTGQFRQVKLEAQGPIVIAGATTKERVYEDNSNRSFLLHIDESSAHQRQILDFQNRLAAGLINPNSSDEICKQIQNIQRLLNPNLRIINPFQPQLQLPEYVFKKLRTNTHYISLIKVVTYLFQHQRTAQNTPNGQLFIQTTLPDVALANELSKHSLLRKSDELSGQLRDFFERLKRTVKEKGKTTFVSKIIRTAFRMNPMTFNRRLRNLQSRGYIKQSGGSYKTSYEYEILIWDDYQVLKNGLNIMDEILDKLWKKYPDGIFRKEIESKNN